MDSQPNWEPYALTVPMAAKLCCRQPWTIYQAIKRGELKAARPGGRSDLMIITEDFKAWLRGQSAAEPEQSDDAAAS